MTRSGALLLCAALASCAGRGELRPFTSDGCSLYPDRAMCGGADWCACCVAHDRAYWRGGTRDQRREADAALRQCVRDESGSALRAAVVHAGVRVGGVPWLYTWFRWGYGWRGLRGYAALSEAEQARVDALGDVEPGVCGSTPAATGRVPEGRTPSSR